MGRPRRVRRGRRHPRRAAADQRPPAGPVPGPPAPGSRPRGRRRRRAAAAGVPGAGLQPPRDAAGGRGARRAHARAAHRRRRLPRRIHGVPGALRQGPSTADIQR